jgi:hypothetical protein
MYVAVLPRKVVGTIFCFVGALTIIVGVLGNGNAGPFVSIVLGSLFAGLGWLSIKSSSRKPSAPLTEPQASKPYPPVSSIPEASPSPETNDVAKLISEIIGCTFSSDNYIKLFGDQSFSNEWTVQQGLAAWYFFGAVAMDIAIFSTVRSSDRLKIFRDSCDRSLSRQWRMSEQVLAEFNDLQQRTGETAFREFMNCKSGDDFAIYSSRCVNRILGCELPFKGLTIDLILAGQQPKTLNLALSASFGAMFGDTIALAKRAIRESGVAGR